MLGVRKKWFSKTVFFKSKIFQLLIFFEIFDFLKSGIWDFFEIFYFPKIGLWKMTHKMFCALTFLKINIFSQIQKQKLRLPLYSPKHPKTWQTDQNSKSYPIFSLGGAFNSWTQFIYRCRILGDTRILLFSVVGCSISAKKLA